jgi:hypothetical protein
MPQVNFESKNQCTFDDPTDGAEAPPATSSAAPPPPSPSATATGCEARDPAAGGSTGECTDQLVRRFGAEGAGSTLAEPSGKACLGATIGVLGSCGTLVYELSHDKGFDVSHAASCLGALVSLADCALGDD